MSATDSLSIIESHLFDNEDNYILAGYRGMYLTSNAENLREIHQFG